MKRSFIGAMRTNALFGMYPDMFYGGVHGDDPKTVFDELLEVVDKWVEIFEQDGKDLPTPTRTALQAA